MKKHSIYLLISGFALLSNMALTSCSDDDVADANDVLAVKSVLPTKVMEGQVVTINGTGLEKATSVVFPGNVSVNDITKIGNGYISVITPAGVSAEGGTVTIEADGESAESVMKLTVGKPEPLRVAPLDKKIKINECVEVYGNDLEFITKAYFPGEDGKDIVVDASDFKRKATGSLHIYSPMGIKAGPAQVVIEDCSGKKYTLPEVTLSDGGAEGGDGDNPFDGEWVWASGVVWGSGAYLADKAPSWWQVSVGDDLDEWAPGEGRAGSSMVFSGSSLTKKRSDGTIAEGKYTVDMTKTKENGAGDVWAVGQLVTEDVTLLCGNWPWADNAHDVYTYDILEITSNRIVLAYTMDGTGEGGQALYWIFERKNTNVATYPVDLDIAYKQTVTLDGIDDIADWWIDPDFFGKIEGSDNKFIFQAMDGNYRISANEGLKYFTVEVLANGNPASLNDDGTGAVWVIGSGIGKPSNANDINWNDGKAICMAPIGNKQYRITLVAGEQIGTESINFKFFHQKSWGGEFKNSTISTTSNLVFVGDGGDDGNIKLQSGTTLENGATYEFVVDLSGGNSNAVLTVTKK